MRLAVRAFNKIGNFSRGGMEDGEVDGLRRQRYAVENAISCDSRNSELPAL